MMGDIRFVASQELPDFPYVTLRRINRPGSAFASGSTQVTWPAPGTPPWGADRPVVLEAITDPDTPTIPPHITWKQAKNFTETILRGDPNESGIIKQAVKGMVARLNAAREIVRAIGVF